MEDQKRKGVKVVKYIECSALLQTNVKNVFEEAVKIAMLGKAKPKNSYISYSGLLIFMWCFYFVSASIILIILISLSFPPFLLLIFFPILLYNL